MGKKIKKESLFETFLRKKPAMLLLNLNNGHTAKYGSVIAKHINCTYSHTIKLLKEMEKFGLVNFQKMGRIKTITLTEKGKEAAKSVGRLKEVL